MSTIDMDALEVVAEILDKSEWQLFAEVCKNNGVNDKRRDALWDAWSQENHIPDWMDKSLKIIMKGTIFKEEQHDHGV